MKVYIVEIYLIPRQTMPPNQSAPFKPGSVRGKTFYRKIADTMMTT